MCGRFAITTAKFNQIEGSLATTVPEVRPRYKISPSQSIPVIRESADGTREEAYATWLNPRTSLDTVRSLMEPYPGLLAP